MNDVLQIIFSGLVAVSTVIYSLLTWKLVTETRKIRKFQITPDINIYFERAEADASFVYIVFKNSGLGHAKNVKFEILKDFKFYDNENFQLNKKGIIKDRWIIFTQTNSINFSLLTYRKGMQRSEMLI